MNLESSKTLPPFQRYSDRALSSLRRTSASSAASFIPTTRDHCGVLRIPYELATLRVNRFPILFGSVRAVKVLLASLRSTLTVLAPREEVRIRSR